MSEGAWGATGKPPIVVLLVLGKHIAPIVFPTGSE